jgi:hypothetical protein
MDVKPMPSRKKKNLQKKVMQQDLQMYLKRTLQVGIFLWSYDRE